MSAHPPPTGSARSRLGRIEGQASVELVAALPLLVVVLLALGQLAVVGHAAWSAANAARAGARAAHVGGDPERVAVDSLPEHLRGDAEVRGDDGVEVRVRAPALIPSLSGIRLGASAALDPAAEGEDG